MLKIAEHKNPQHNSESEEFLRPRRLYLPLSQHTGRPAAVSVKINQIVEKNQLIAEADGYISASLHAPLRSKITDIKRVFHPKLAKAKGIVLETQDQRINSKASSAAPAADKLNPADTLNIISKSGIVGMGGAGFPANVKLKPPKKVDTLIINGCECEPYLAADYRLMVENLGEIFKGIEIIARLIEPQTIIFAIEENKPEAIKKINLFVHTKKIDLPKIKLAVLKTQYPQGGEKQLIYRTTRRKVSAQMLPHDAGCLVNNVATCFAIYEAVYLNQPLTRRLVTFAGDALAKPKNIWVNIGTSVEELIAEKIINFSFQPEKIIFGGPMMGEAVSSLETPILKTTSCILFLKNAAGSTSESACIKCGRCVDSCPMKLLPAEYMRSVKHNRYENLDSLWIKDCIECGSCSYACPAEIPILDYIKVGKEKIKTRQ